METDSRPSLEGLKVVSFESRRAKEMAELIRRYGGEPFVAPSMREIPLHENPAALSLLTELESGKFDLLILMTGVGTKTLNEVLLTRYSEERIKAALQKVKLVARGPKPVAALKDLSLQPALVVPEPNTWREILASLDSIQDESSHAQRVVAGDRHHWSSRILRRRRASLQSAERANLFGIRIRNEP